MNTLLDPLISVYEPSLEFRADLVDANKHVHHLKSDTISVLDHTNNDDKSRSLVSVFSSVFLAIKCTHSAAFDIFPDQLYVSRSRQLEAALHLHSFRTKKKKAKKETTMMTRLHVFTSCYSSVWQC